MISGCRPGRCSGLLGPNGAGKTTTILMLLGLVEPTSGDIEVLGLDPARNPLEVKSHVGYLPDAVGFYDGLTGRENLRFTAQLNRIGRGEAESRITDLLAEVGLTEAGDNPAGTYSRGMKQRLGIADALIKEPSILILDEPTTSIDPEGVAEMLGLIRALRGRPRRHDPAVEPSASPGAGGLRPRCHLRPGNRGRSGRPPPARHRKQGPRGGRGACRSRRGTASSGPGQSKVSPEP